MKITDLPLKTRLIQLAEEAAELSQAALKLVRAMDGDTPVPEAKARNMLIEEIADTRLCSCAIITDLDELIIEGVINQKLRRWEERINATKRRVERGSDD